MVGRNVLVAGSVHQAHLGPAPACNRRRCDIRPSVVSTRKIAVSATTVPPTPVTSASYGVHSEVGVLRKVLVCAPGLAHSRLTPRNCDDLLFDDVIWVENARRDHFDFVNEMRARGVQVVELHDLLTETMAIPEAKAWLLDRKVTANEVGLGL